MVFWTFWVLGPILAHQTAKFELSFYREALFEGIIMEHLNQNLVSVNPAK